MKIRNLSIIGIFTGMLCIIAPISFPLVPVSITLASFGIYLIGTLFDYKKALIIVLLYIVLGAIGLPVFSNFEGGLSKLISPTGGYIIAYIPCVLLISLLITKFKQYKFIYPIALTIGTLLLYVIGTIWFMLYMEGSLSFTQALLVCVVPFIFGDVIKICVAIVIGIKCRPFIDKLNINNSALD